jgi:dephospho-CoA kinase
VSKLVLLGGATGVGKTTALKLLEDRLPKLALLDADDVWRISDDLAVEGTRSIAIANVTSVLQGYADAGCDTAILGWVFARSPLYEPVIAAMQDTFDTIHQVYLVASPEAIRARLDSRGSLDRLEYSISRLQLIQKLPYPQIDTTDLSPVEVVDRILSHIRNL